MPPTSQGKERDPAAGDVAAQEPPLGIRWTGRPQRVAVTAVMASAIAVNIGAMSSVTCRLQGSPVKPKSADAPRAHLVHFNQKSTEVKAQVV